MMAASSAALAIVNFGFNLWVFSSYIEHNYFYLAVRSLRQSCVYEL